MAVLRVVLICLIVASVVASSADADADKPKKDGGLKELKPVKVLYPKHYMPMHRVIIVPKGDPRARPPVQASDFAPYPFALPTTPSTPAAFPGSSTVLRASATTAACAAKQGTCKESSTCTGTIVTGICNGGNSVTCCTPKAGTTPTTPSTPSTPTGSCPLYANAPTSRIAGNGGVSYDVVRILAQHFAGGADNTMTKPTACAFAKMAEAAKNAGTRIIISSGFRTLARQQYFWGCYRNCNCNSCNEAASPGTSNHGRGQALDLNTDCGKQSKTSTRAPAACRNSAVYRWLLANGPAHGFVRAVHSEPWHWEYKPGQANPSWAALP